MMLLPLVNTLYNTSSYTVLLYIAVLDELTVCLCTQTGCTALHLAAQEGKVDVVRLLTEAQAQINIQTEVQYIHTCGIMYAYSTCAMCILLNRCCTSCRLAHAGHMYCHYICVSILYWIILDQYIDYTTR